MEIAVLIVLIGLSLKPSFVRSTYPKEASIVEFGSGLNLDLSLAGIHEGKSAELNLDLSLGNEVYKSNKAPTANRLTSIRFASNPLYFAEAGPSRSGYLSLGLGSGKNYVTSDTDSTKRSISQLDLQANFYLHAPHDTLDPEKHSGERITLGDSQNMRKIVTNNDGSSDVIERNHGTIHDNLPHKRKYMAENFPTETGAQYQNFPHNPGLKSFETSTSSNEISHGKNLIAKVNEAQKIRISAGGSRPTKKQKVSNLETINIGRKYRTDGTLKTEEGIESEKIEIWKDVKQKH
ncbi:hypothetical protein BY996DRAFT_1545678 [Phakopsora pachyrhizi]|nr:hypothetical protein BY996DRAFT_1545678 [Phakopsora pachyrhizi]